MAWGFLIAGCGWMTLKPAGAAAPATTLNCRIYQDVQFSKISAWTPTDIHVSKGAMVAILARGEVRHVGRMERRFQPFQRLRFRVGTEGPIMPIRSGDDRNHPANTNARVSEREGSLHYFIGGGRQPEKERGEFAATVLVWDRDNLNRIEEDIRELIRLHPGDAQYPSLLSAFGWCFFQRGEYERAERMLKSARESASDPGIGFTVSAAMEMKLGRYDRAKAYAEEALRVSRSAGNREMEGRALFNIGRALARMGAREEAVRFGQQALEIAQHLKRRRLDGNVHRWLGELRLKDDPAAALAHCEEALRFFQAFDAWGNAPGAYLCVGRAQLGLNRTQDAERSLQAAVREANQWGSQEPLWRAHHFLGNIAESRGDDPGAFDHYAEAIRIVEAMRAKLTDPSLKAAFMEDRLQVYERMIKLLYRLKRVDEALNFVERAKARVMLDMLEEKAFSSAKPQENALLARERAVREEMEGLAAEEGEATVEDPPEAEEEDEGEDAKKSPEPPVGRGADLRRLQAEHQSILEELERLNPELASLVSIRPLKAEEIQGLLDPDMVLLEYFVGQGMSLVFAVTRDGVQAAPVKASPEDLFQRIQTFRRSAVDEIDLEQLERRDYEGVLGDLYDMLIGPVEKRIGGKAHLVVVPHGVLHYLPFQALRSAQGRYLIESFRISYLPSASVLQYARMKNRGNRSDLLAVGNPATDLPPLPAAEEEAREVSALFEKKTLLTGREATKRSVRSESSQHDMILFSTHGEMLDSDPMGSNLRFAPSAQDDGRLTVGEIFDMQIRANLVTLSACETGLAKGAAGDFPRGDDLVGLTRAFIYAGAPSVVASLWKVSDDSTVAFMRAFYQYLKNLPKAEALRRAQLDLMKAKIPFRVERGGTGVTRSASYRPGLTIDCSHPFFWAPFILVGDWR